MEDNKIKIIGASKEHEVKIGIIGNAGQGRSTAAELSAMDSSLIIISEELRKQTEEHEQSEYAISRTAENTGIKEDEIRKLAKAANISEEEAANMIEDLINEPYAERAVKATEDLRIALKRLTENYDRSLSNRKINSTKTANINNNKKKKKRKASKKSRRNNRK